MLTLIFTFTWPDSVPLTAVMEAVSPDEEFEVRYSGAQGRLPSAVLTRCTPSMLRICMEDLAAELGAALSVATSGSYDRWAQ